MFIAWRTLRSPRAFSTLPVRSEMISRVVWPWKPMTSMPDALTSLTEGCSTRMASIWFVLSAETAAVSLVMTLTARFLYG